MTFISLLLCLCLALAGAESARAQTACSTGPSSTGSATQSWVEPQAPGTVSAQIPTSLKRLGYTLRESASAEFVTAPKFSWPSVVNLSGAGPLTYPGAEVVVALEPVGPWTRVRLTTRLVCETRQRPPPTYPQDLDFDAFVLERTHFQVEDAVSAPLSRMKVRTLAESCAPLRPGKQTLEVCRQIVNARPSDPDTHRQYAIQLARSGRADEVWAPLRRLAALEGEQPATYLEVGDAMFVSGLFAAAERLYERAIELWPADARMALRFGRTKLELKQPDRAVSALLAAVALDPVSGFTQWYAAAALTGIGRKQEALEHCQFAANPLADAVRERPDDVDAWLGLTFCAFAFGRYRESIAFYERAFVADAARAQSADYVVAVVKLSETMLRNAAPPSRPTPTP